MLTEFDKQRLDEIMDRVFEKREQRGYLPDRDEDKIAEILSRGDDAARIEHERLLEARGFGSPARDKIKAVDSVDEKSFDTLSRWKNRETEEE